MDERYGESGLDNQSGSQGAKNVSAGALSDAAKAGGTHTDNFFNLAVDGMGIVNKDASTGKHQGGVMAMEMGENMDVSDEAIRQDAGIAATDPGRLNAGMSSVDITGIGEADEEKE